MIETRKNLKEVHPDVGTILPWENRDSLDYVQYTSWRWDISLPFIIKKKG